MRASIARVTLSRLLAGSLLLALQTPAHARPPEVHITPESELRFGSFMVFDNGSRTVTPLGNVTDVSLVAIEGEPVGPARFTVSYDRGNESRQVIDIVLELVITPPARVSQPGLSALLSGLETDLPGTSGLLPGQPIRITLNNCRQRVCSTTFNVGGRLSVSRQFGGASLAIPIPVDVAVISAREQ